MIYHDILKFRMVFDCYIELPEGESGQIWIDDSFLQELGEVKQPKM